MQAVSTRKRLALALLTATVAMLALPALASATPAAPEVHGVWRATGTHVKSLNCDRIGGARVGEALIGARWVSLDAKRTCDPLVDYKRTGSLTNWTIDALVTVGHEAAHLRHVTNEARAECLGVRFAWAWMKRNGVFSTYVAAPIKRQLLDDSNRRPAYKLRGTCALG